MIGFYKKGESYAWFGGNTANSIFQRNAFA